MDGSVYFSLYHYLGGGICTHTQNQPFRLKRSPPHTYTHTTFLANLSGHLSSKASSEAFIYNRHPSNPASILYVFLDQAAIQSSNQPLNALFLPFCPCENPAFPHFVCFVFCHLLFSGNRLGGVLLFAIHLPQKP